MKKITYLIILAVTAFGFIACEDDDEKIFETGNWNYEAPHFEFEYATDSIAFGMPGSEMKIGVEQLKTMFLDMATEKMQEYFVGIDFYSEDSLLIKAQMSTGIIMPINAGYKQSDEFIEITFDKDVMNELVGPASAMIPPISFNFIQENQKTTMYFNEIYVRSIFENTAIQNMLIPMIARTLNPRFDEMPEIAQAGMIAGIQLQISGVLNQIEKLELGFVLTK